MSDTNTRFFSIRLNKDEYPGPVTSSITIRPCDSDAQWDTIPLTKSQETDLAVVYGANVDSLCMNVTYVYKFYVNDKNVANPEINDTLENDNGEYIYKFFIHSDPVKALDTRSDNIDNSSAADIDSSSSTPFEFKDSSDEGVQGSQVPSGASAIPFRLLEGHESAVSSSADLLLSEIRKVTEEYQENEEDMHNVEKDDFIGNSSDSDESGTNKKNIDNTILTSDDLAGENMDSDVEPTDQMHFDLDNPIGLIDDEDTIVNKTKMAELVENEVIETLSQSRGVQSDNGPVLNSDDTHKDSDVVAEEHLVAPAGAPVPTEDVKPVEDPSVEFSQSPDDADPKEESPEPLTDDGTLDKEESAANVEDQDRQDSEDLSQIDTALPTQVVEETPEASAPLVEPAEVPAERSIDIASEDAATFDDHTDIRSIDGNIEETQSLTADETNDPIDPIALETVEDTELTGDSAEQLVEESESSEDELVVDKPAVDEPAVDEPAVDELAVDEATGDNVAETNPDSAPVIAEDSEPVEANDPSSSIVEEEPIPSGEPTVDTPVISDNVAISTSEEDQQSEPRPDAESILNAEASEENDFPPANEDPASEESIPEALVSATDKAAEQESVSEPKVEGSAITSDDMAREIIDEQAVLLESADPIEADNVPSDADTDPEGSVHVNTDNSETEAKVVDTTEDVSKNVEAAGVDDMTDEPLVSSVSGSNEDGAALTKDPETADEPTVPASDEAVSSSDLPTLSAVEDSECADGGHPAEEPVLSTVEEVEPKIITDYTTAIDTNEAVEQPIENKTELAHESVEEPASSDIVEAEPGAIANSSFTINASGLDEEQARTETDLTPVSAEELASSAIEEFISEAITDSAPTVEPRETIEAPVESETELAPVSVEEPVDSAIIEAGPESETIDTNKTVEGQVGTEIESAPAPVEELEILAIEEAKSEAITESAPAIDSSETIEVSIETGTDFTSVSVENTELPTVMVTEPETIDTSEIVEEQVDTKIESAPTSAEEPVPSIVEETEPETVVDSASTVNLGETIEIPVETRTELASVSVEDTELPAVEEVGPENINTREIVEDQVETEAAPVSESAEEPVLSIVEEAKSETITESAPTADPSETIEEQIGADAESTPVFVEEPESSTVKEVDPEIVDTSGSIEELVGAEAESMPEPVEDSVPSIVEGAEPESATDSTPIVEDESSRSIEDTKNISETDTPSVDAPITGEPDLISDTNVDTASHDIEQPPSSSVEGGAELAIEGPTTASACDIDGLSASEADEKIEPVSDHVEASEEKPIANNLAEVDSACSSSGVDYVEKEATEELDIPVVENSELATEDSEYVPLNIDLSEESPHVSVDDENTVIAQTLEEENDKNDVVITSPSGTDSMLPVDENQADSQEAAQMEPTSKTVVLDSAEEGSSEPQITDTTGTVETSVAILPSIEEPSANMDDSHISSMDDNTAERSVPEEQTPIVTQAEALSSEASAAEEYTETLANDKEHTIISADNIDSSESQLDTDEPSAEEPKISEPLVESDVSESNEASSAEQLPPSTSERDIELGKDAPNIESDEPVEGISASSDPEPLADTQVEQAETHEQNTMATSDNPEITEATDGSITETNNNAEEADPNLPDNKDTLDTDPNHTSSAESIMDQTTPLEENNEELNTSSGSIADATNPVVISDLENDTIPNEPSGSPEENAADHDSTHAPETDNNRSIDLSLDPLALHASDVVESSEPVTDDRVEDQSAPATDAVASEELKTDDPESVAVSTPALPVLDSEETDERTDPASDEAVEDPNNIPADELSITSVSAKEDVEHTIADDNVLSSGDILEPMEEHVADSAMEVSEESLALVENESVEERDLADTKESNVINSDISNANVDDHEPDVVSRSISESVEPITDNAEMIAEQPDTLESGIALAATVAITAAAIVATEPTLVDESTSEDQSLPVAEEQEPSERSIPEEQSSVDESGIPVEPLASEEPAPVEGADKSAEEQLADIILDESKSSENDGAGIESASGSPGNAEVPAQSKNIQSDNEPVLNSDVTPEDSGVVAEEHLVAPAGAPVPTEDVKPVEDPSVEFSQSPDDADPKEESPEPLTDDGTLDKEESAANVEDQDRQDSEDLSQTDTALPTQVVEETPEASAPLVEPAEVPAERSIDIASEDAATFDDHTNIRSIDGNIEETQSLTADETNDPIDPIALETVEDTELTGDSAEQLVEESKSSEDELVVDKPAVDEPAVDEPAVDELAVDEATGDNVAETNPDSAPVIAEDSEPVEANDPSSSIVEEEPIPSGEPTVDTPVISDNVAISTSEEDQQSEPRPDAESILNAEASEENDFPPANEDPASEESIPEALVSATDKAAEQESVSEPKVEGSAITSDDMAREIIDEQAVLLESADPIEADNVPSDADTDPEGSVHVNTDNSETEAKVVDTTEDVSKNVEAAGVDDMTDEPLVSSVSGSNEDGAALTKDPETADEPTVPASDEAVSSSDLPTLSAVEDSECVGDGHPAEESTTSVDGEQTMFTTDNADLIVEAAPPVEETPEIQTESNTSAIAKEPSEPSSDVLDTVNPIATDIGREIPDESLDPVSDGVLTSDTKEISAAKEECITTETESVSAMDNSNPAEEPIEDGTEPTSVSIEEPVLPSVEEVKPKTNEEPIRVDTESTPVPAEDVELLTVEEAGSEAIDTSETVEELVDTMIEPAPASTEEPESSIVEEAKSETITESSPIIDDSETIEAPVETVPELAHVSAEEPESPATVEAKPETTPEPTPTCDTSKSVEEQVKADAEPTPVSVEEPESLVTEETKTEPIADLVPTVDPSEAIKEHIGADAESTPVPAEEPGSSTVKEAGSETIDTSETVEELAGTMIEPAPASTEEPESSIVEEAKSETITESAPIIDDSETIEASVENETELAPVSVEEPESLVTEETKSEPIADLVPTVDPSEAIEEHIGVDAEPTPAPAEEPESSTVEETGSETINTTEHVEELAGIENEPAPSSFEEPESSIVEEAELETNADFAPAVEPRETIEASVESEIELAHISVEESVESAIDETKPKNTSDSVPTVDVSDMVEEQVGTETSPISEPAEQPESTVIEEVEPEAVLELTPTVDASESIEEQSGTETNSTPAAVEDMELPAVNEADPETIGTSEAIEEHIETEAESVPVSAEELTSSAVEETEPETITDSAPTIDPSETIETPVETETELAPVSAEEPTSSAIVEAGPESETIGTSETVEKVGTEIESAPVSVEDLESSAVEEVKSEAIMDSALIVDASDSVEDQVETEAAPVSESAEEPVLSIVEEAKSETITESAPTADPSETIEEQIGADAESTPVFVEEPESSTVKEVDPEIVDTSGSIEELVSAEAESMPEPAEDSVPSIVEGAEPESATDSTPIVEDESSRSIEDTKNISETDTPSVDAPITGEPDLISDTNVDTASHDIEQPPSSSVEGGAELAIEGPTTTSACDIGDTTDIPSLAVNEYPAPAEDETAENQNIIVSDITTADDTTEPDCEVSVLSDEQIVDHDIGEDESGSVHADDEPSMEQTSDEKGTRSIVTPTMIEEPAESIAEETELSEEQPTVSAIAQPDDTPAHSENEVAGVQTDESSYVPVPTEISSTVETIEVDSREVDPSEEQLVASAVSGVDDAHVSNEDKLVDSQTTNEPSAPEDDEKVVPVSKRVEVSEEEPAVNDLAEVDVAHSPSEIDSVEKEATEELDVSVVEKPESVTENTESIPVNADLSEEPPIVSAADEMEPSIEESGSRELGESIDAPIPNANKSDDKQISDESSMTSANAPSPMIESAESVLDELLCSDEKIITSDTLHTDDVQSQIEDESSNKSEDPIAEQCVESVSEDTKLPAKQSDIDNNSEGDDIRIDSENPTESIIEETGSSEKKSEVHNIVEVVDTSISVEEGFVEEHVTDAPEVSEADTRDIDETRDLSVPNEESPAEDHLAESPAEETCPIDEQPIARGIDEVDFAPVHNEGMSVEKSSMDNQSSPMVEEMGILPSKNDESVYVEASSLKGQEIDDSDNQEAKSVTETKNNQIFELSNITDVDPVAVVTGTIISDTKNISEHKELYSTTENTKTKRSIDDKFIDEMDSAIYTEHGAVSETSVEALKDKLKAGLESPQPIISQPSYIMHYPESLYGDAASSMTPGLITMEELNTAQKATAVIGVSTVNVTANRNRPWLPGMLHKDDDHSISLRVKRFISNKRNDHRTRAETSMLPHSVSDGRYVKSMATKAASNILGERKESIDHESAEISRTATVVSEQFDEAKKQTTIPGTYPAGERDPAKHGSNTKDDIYDGNGDGDLEESPHSSDNEGNKSSRHRRHTILGVFKRMFR